MTDRGRRLGKGIAIALAVHIIAAALLGILGYRFTQRPPQILEVTLGGGGGGGGKGSAAAEKELLRLLLLLRCSSKNSSLRR